jgi:hypothetical protein
VNIARPNVRPIPGEVKGARARPRRIGYTKTAAEADAMDEEATVWSDFA